MAKRVYKKRRDEVAIKRVGDNIRKYRKLNGLTIAQLAFKMEVDPKQVSKMELAKTDSNITMLKLVSQHLEIDITLLFMD